MRQEQIDRYLDLMVEIDRRVRAINAALDNSFSSLYNVTNAESVCLQFRKVFECIAFGTLVANESVHSGPREILGKHWHAERTLKFVGELNPANFPRPFDPSLPHLGLEEFKSNYGKFGDLLHAENPFGRPKDYQAFLDQAPELMLRLKNLLWNHLLTLPTTGELLQTVFLDNEASPVQVRHLVAKKAG